MLETDPIEIKRLGGSFLDTPEWKNERREVMKSLLIAKFEQNPIMLGKLMATGNKPLIEANWDKTWASAAPFLSKEISNWTWKGNNLLGLLLVEVRIEFRQRKDPQTQDKDENNESDQASSNDDSDTAEGAVEGGN